MRSAGHDVGIGAAPVLRVRPLTGRPGFEVAGEVALGTRPQWEAALDRALGAREESDVHLDLAHVTFVDAGGAAVLTRAARRLGPGGRLVLHDAPPALCRVLGLLWPDERTIVVRPR